MPGKQLLVIGGGAAGFFCAVNAARMNPALKVTLVEKTGKLLSKVKVSGGGRCNVTHACFDIVDMVTRYPRGAQFLKKAFHRFFTTDTIQWFEERGIPLKTEADGRMFPATDTSQTIIDCLLKEAERYRVEILLHAEVSEIRTTASGFDVQLKNGQQMQPDYICAASGGYPKKEMFQWLRETGHTIEMPVPSLFTFNLPGNGIIKLPGLSVPLAAVKITGTKFKEEGPLLITHWGLSGPVVLKLSAWGARELAARNWNFSIMVNWVTWFNENTMRQQLQLFRKEKATQSIYGKPLFDLPRRLWEYFLVQSGISEKTRWADLPAVNQNLLSKILCSQSFEVNGKTTFKEEFVTAGGIDFKEVDAQTMQSKLVPGLFFAGEALDIDGITGGFNFQSAWTTAWIAAQDIARLSAPEEDKQEN
jgi:predicted Rossmann fold flavoprotein